MKGAHETKAAAAPTAQPRASTEIKSLTGTPQAGVTSKPAQAGHAANHHPTGGQQG